VEVFELVSMAARSIPTVIKIGAYVGRAEVFELVSMAARSISKRDVEDCNVEEAWGRLKIYSS
jgi:hypothetical protein